MGRLCERPGCSEVAAVAYGMRAEDLVFWLDALRLSSGPESGVLCQRHGDSMIVPRGWTLDDLRDPDLHLFRPPPRPDGPARRRSRPRRRSNASDDTGQLALGGLVEQLDEDHHEHGDEPAEPSADNGVASGRAEVSAEPNDAPEPEEPTGRPLVADEDAASALAWKPAFDDGDDLGGLLAARSPLLSRAFRGTDRDG